MPCTLAQRIKGCGMHTVLQFRHMLPPPRHWGSNCPRQWATLHFFAVMQFGFSKEIHIFWVAKALKISIPHHPVDTFSARPSALMAAQPITRQPRNNGASPANQLELCEATFVVSSSHNPRERGKDTTCYLCGRKRIPRHRNGSNIPWGVIRNDQKSTKW